MAKRRTSKNRKSSLVIGLTLLLVLLVSVLVSLLYLTFQKKENLLLLSKRTVLVVDGILEGIDETSSLLLSVQQENMESGQPYLYTYKRYEYQASTAILRKKIAKQLSSDPGTQKVRILFFSEKKQDGEKLTTMKIGFYGIVFYQIEFVAPLPDSTDKEKPVEPLVEPSGSETNINKPADVGKPVVKGKIVIILDDVGSEPDRLFQKFIAFPGKITFSVMPNKPNTAKRVAKLKTIKRFMIMLHQPLEPQGWEAREMRLEEKTILTNMTADEIKNILNDSIRQVPAKGMNNHQGSLATSNPRVMTVVMQVLRSRRMFFIDSYTSADSVGEYIAGKMRVKYGKREVFLDNENSEAYVQKQFDHLVRIALKEGKVIGIGHGTKQSTMTVLMKNYDKVKAKGLEFVWPDELVE